MGGLPKIALVDLMAPPAASASVLPAFTPGPGPSPAPSGAATLLQQPQGTSQGLPNGRHIIAILWILDSHPLVWKQLYSAGFTTLRRLLPDFVQIMVARNEADLTFDK